MSRDDVGARGPRTVLVRGPRHVVECAHCPRRTYQTRGSPCVDAPYFLPFPPVCSRSQAVVTTNRRRARRLRPPRSRPLRRRQPSRPGRSWPDRYPRSPPGPSSARSRRSPRAAESHPRSSRSRRSSRAMGTTSPRATTCKPTTSARSGTPPRSSTTPTTGASRPLFQIGAGQVIPGWDQALPRQEGRQPGGAGHPAGARLRQSRASHRPGIKGTDTLVFVRRHRRHLQRQELRQGQQGRRSATPICPRWATTPTARPRRSTVPKGDAPKKLVSKYVIEGDGAKVKAADARPRPVHGACCGRAARSSTPPTPRASSPSSRLQQVVKGWSQGLTGKKVGSRVLIVIPPELGYGKKDQQGIPGNSTLVFSVDILAAL